MKILGTLVADEKLVASLTPALRSLALKGQIRSYRKHTVIVNEGDAGESLFVLLQGRVKAYSNDSEGREITYNVIEQGDYFAEMCIDGGPRSASIMTLEPSVCSVVGRAALQEHLAQDPEFSLNLMAQIARRARSATDIARNMALLDVYGRVVVILESQQGPASVDTPIDLTQITHQSIASRVGASREMVSRLLKDLEKGGYIALGVKRIKLLKKLPARW